MIKNIKKQASVSFLITAIGALSPAISMEKDNNSSSDISSFITNLGCKVLHNFDPKKIDTIVVGCDMVSHENHFFASRAKDGLDSRISANVDAENRLEIEYRLFPKNEDEKSYITSSKKEILQEIRNNQNKYSTESYDNYNENNNSIKYSCDVSVDTSTTLYINKSDCTYGDTQWIGLQPGKMIHILGCFEKIIEMPFLTTVQKIIIEFHCQRTEDDYKKFINNAYIILVVGGSLYIEHPVNGFSNYKGYMEDLSMENFKLKRTYIKIPEVHKRCSKGVVPVVFYKATKTK